MQHNRDKPTSQPRKSSTNHDQKNHSTKKDELMNKVAKEPASMYPNQLNKNVYTQQPFDTATKNTVAQSQKQHQKSHTDRSAHTMANSLNQPSHMNAMNSLQSQQTANLLNADPLPQNMMQAATKANTLAVEPQQQQSQHHIQNTHAHQPDLTGNTTPNTELKQHTSPTGDIPSMGVYTPDSTTNSVHSLHHYGQCDLDVAQLGLECKYDSHKNLYIVYRLVAVMSGHYCFGSSSKRLHVCT